MADQIVPPLAFGHLPEAIYIPAEIAEYRGNPLIEALPPYRTVAEMDTSLGRFPKWSPDEVNLRDGLRILKIVSFRAWLEPLPHHEEVIDSMGAILRGGYTTRNPALASDSKRRVELYRSSMLAGGSLPFDEAVSSTAPSLTLCGTSGVGKTSLVEYALGRLFPMAIYHPNLRCVQIVYLKLDCPPDGNLKQFLIDAVQQIDRIIDERHSIGLQSRTPAELIPVVASLCRRYNVGMIIIDEIQNLLLKKHADRRWMMNFIVGLMNNARVPVMTMGTPAALELIKKSLKLARRTGEFGTILWDRMHKDEIWHDFLAAMLKFSWIRNPVAHEPSIGDALYHESQGIPGLVTRLYQLVQVQAIVDGTETISAESIAQVAKKRFSVLAPMLKALREGREVDKWEDLFREVVDQIDRQLDLAHQVGPRRRISPTAREVAIRALAALYPKETVTSAIDELLHEDPTMGETTIIQRARNSLDGLDSPLAELGASLKDEVAGHMGQGLSVQETVDRLNFRGTEG